MKPLSLALLLAVSMSGNAAPAASYTYTNWTIDNSSVCNNYKYGSVIYRDCRSGALEFFRDQCEKHKQTVENLGVNTPEVTRHEKDMFCHAASTFSPVN